jgi:ABC-type Mn2+/Zn2+ transport system permease subunit
MVVVSMGAAAGATVGGLLLSYQLDWPSGATVVLLLSLIFFLSAFFKQRRGRAIR